MHMKILLDWIENTVHEMETLESAEYPSPRIMSSLRELQLLVNPLVFTAVDSRSRFIAFFLNSYIDTIFMDLLGDIPDDPDEILLTIRNHFFEDVKQKLDMLLNKLRNSEDPLPAVEELVGVYATAVRDLNYRDVQMGGRHG